MDRKLKDRNTLVRMTPPRVSDREISTVVHLMEALRDQHTFALEIAYADRRMSLMIRSPFGSGVRRTAAAELQGWDLSKVPPGEDPVRVGLGERIHTLALHFDGLPHAPIRTFDDASVLRDRFDPLTGVTGALKGMARPGERVDVRLVLQPVTLDWLSDRRRAGLTGSGGENQRLANMERQADRSVWPRVLKIGAGVLAMAAGWLVYANPDLLPGTLERARSDGVLSGVMGIPSSLGVGEPLGILLGLGAAGVCLGLYWARLRSQGGPEYLDPAAVRERLSWGGFRAELQVHAIVPEGPSSGRRARDLCTDIASMYNQYSNPVGSRVAESWRSTDMPTASGLVSLEERWWKPLTAVVRRLARKCPPIGSLEAGSLWHPPHPDADPHRVLPRMRYRPLAYNGPEITDGVLFGVTTGGPPQLARFSPAIMGLHQLYIGGTRMGKTTLMKLGLVQRMRAKARGEDTAALVVVDPHSDLVNDLLEQVPRSLRDRVWLVDLSAGDRLPAINLLDTRVFPNRDLTCDGIARVARGIWSQYWGPRMEAVMAYTAKALYEANLKRRREQQYTILDAHLMLTDQEFRGQVLRQVEDAKIIQWWQNDFRNMSAAERSEYVGPIRTRLGQFAASEKVGRIFGQPASTIPLSEAIANGDVIFVNTASGIAGRDVASLMGAAVLNLVDATIRRSAELPADQRGRLMVVVDEAQSIPGINYDDMLGEAAKFGASFILGTQSLSNLDKLSPTGDMRTALTANAGCLVMFNCEHGDADYLARQMGREFVTADDVRGLPSHHAYVQYRTGGVNLPPYTVRLLWPEPGDPKVAELIRRDTRLYTVPTDLAERRARARIIASISGTISKLRGPRLAEE